MCAAGNLPMPCSCWLTRTARNVTGCSRPPNRPRLQRAKAVQPHWGVDQQFSVWARSSCPASGNPALNLRQDFKAWWDTCCSQITLQTGQPCFPSGIDHRKRIRIRVVRIAPNVTAVAAASHREAYCGLHRQTTIAEGENGGSRQEPSSPHSYRSPPASKLHELVGQGCLHF